jgi:cell division protein FtsB
MMLMMVASLTAFAQYPTTKKIKGTSVVIMTVPQAEQIDERFEVLNDSIVELNKQIKTKVHEVRVVDFQREKTFDSLQIFKTNLFIANTTIDSLNREVKRIEKLEYVEKRTRMRLGVGLVGILTTFITFAILVIKS